MKKYRGFTLIELLIVIMLLGFLSISGLSLFQGSQKRARDSRRKSDLSQIAKALEMYANDYGGYPGIGFGGSGDAGKIMGCGTAASASVCNWGSAWTRVTTYMQRLPKDPGSGSYCYVRDPSAGKWYKLYANLERTDDPDYDASLTCASQSYTYVLISSNITPTPTP